MSLIVWLDFIKMSYVLYYNFVILINMKTTIINVIIAAGTLLILWSDNVTGYLAIPFLSLALIFRLVQITTEMKS